MEIDRSWLRARAPTDLAVDPADLSWRTRRHPLATRSSPEPSGLDVCDRGASTDARPPR
jgi:hypothetical protein